MGCDGRGLELSYAGRVPGVGCDHSFWSWAVLVGFKGWVMLVGFSSGLGW